MDERTALSKYTWICTCVVNQGEEKPTQGAQQKSGFALHFNSISTTKGNDTNYRWKTYNQESQEIVIIKRKYDSDNGTVRSFVREHKFECPGSSNHEHL